MENNNRTINLKDGAIRTSVFSSYLTQQSKREGAGCFFIQPEELDVRNTILVKENSVTIWFKNGEHVRFEIVKQ